ncbi:unnamed protein product [Paramecium pentaurelia]|uniref:Transmembrane protein n=1 Tax=Paramecium pentaurelia TaxID=43138 RepID=A0A8S1T2C1_9CILI|nr:unnamed protein product [Paramecium pentaurelia]
MDQQNQSQRVVICSELPENPIATKMTQKEDRTCGGRFRWNLIINGIIIIMAAFPFYLPLEATLGINCFYASLWMIFTILAALTQSKIHQTMKKFQNNMEQSSLPNSSQIKFILITFIYKEPLELLLKTLQNVSQQRIAKEIIMLVCMEEKTPDKETKLSPFMNNSKTVLVNQLQLFILMEHLEKYQVNVLIIIMVLDLSQLIQKKVILTLIQISILQLILMLIQSFQKLT